MFELFFSQIASMHLDDKHDITFCIGWCSNDRMILMLLTESKVCACFLLSEKAPKWKRSSGLDYVEVPILSKLNKEDGCVAEEHFGLHVTSILCSLPPRQRAYTKIEIDRLLSNDQFSEPLSDHPLPPFIPTSLTHKVHSVNF